MPSSRQRATSPALPAGGQHHDRTAGAASGVSLMRSASVEAVHLRHVAVEQRPGRTAGRCGAPVRTASRAAAPSSTTVGRMPQLRKHLLEDAAVGGVVVHDQHRQPAQPSRLGSDGPGATGLSVPRPKRAREMEGAALARLRSRPRCRPPIMLDQPGARSSGPGRCRRTRRVVEPSACAKASKISCCLSARDADAGVAHGEVQDGQDQDRGSRIEDRRGSSIPILIRSSILILPLATRRTRRPRRAR